MLAPEGFSEAGYLAKHRDVAEAVSNKAIPSGLWHYLNHGQYEGREYLAKPMEATSEAWKTFKKFALYHDRIDDFSLFLQMMDRLKKKDSFHVARYNDGEWVFMLKIEPYYSQYLKNHNHNPEEVEQISARLLRIIESYPPYYIGIDSTTRALRGSIANKRDLFKRKVDPLPNVIFGDIFNAATVWFGIQALLNPLKTRHTICVGPAHMRKLNLSDHVEVPTTNCWNKADSISAQLEAKIQASLDKHPVILYSCSLLAKALIDDNYHRYGNKITQLDVGSCVDPWCGVATRPWHPELARHYNLDAKAHPDFFCT